LGTGIALLLGNIERRKTMAEGTKALELSDANFEQEVLKAEKPALVDFWAAWCGPCKIQGPVIEKVVDKVAGRAVVGKVNVDANSELASKYGVMSIPTLVIFKGGSEVKRFVGVQPESVLTDALEKAM